MKDLETKIAEMVNGEGCTLSHRRPASLSVGGELRAYVKMSKIPVTCSINRQISKHNIIIMPGNP